MKLLKAPYRLYGIVHLNYDIHAIKMKFLSEFCSSWAPKGSEIIRKLLRSNFDVILFESVDFLFILLRIFRCKSIYFIPVIYWQEYFDIFDQELLPLHFVFIFFVMAQESDGGLTFWIELFSMTLGRKFL